MGYNLVNESAGSISHLAFLAETQETGPLPFTYLAGSIQRPLSSEAFRESVKYLLKLDADHLPAFFDASLRNAGG